MEPQEVVRWGDGAVESREDSGGFWFSDVFGGCVGWLMLLVDGFLKYKNEGLQKKRSLLPFASFSDLSGRRLINPGAAC